MDEHSGNLWGEWLRIDDPPSVKKRGGPFRSATAYCGLSAKYLYDLVSMERIVARKVGTAVLLSRKELDEFIDGGRKREKE